MKALMMILAAAVTMMSTTSHAKFLACGKWVTDQSVTLTNNEGVLNASNIAQYQPHSTQQGQAGEVFVGK